MNTISILDTETTGMTPEDGQCIEIAVVRYSIKYQAMIDCRSWLLWANQNPLENINHIPTKLLNWGRHHPPSIWDEVCGHVDTSDAILAHNADFDMQWAPKDHPLIRLPWIDTCNGVDWPLQSKPSSSLISLALDHGLAVVDPHRALNDCLLLSRLLTRVAELGHDVEQLLSKGLRPAAMFRAMVSFEEKDLAKEAGFKWDGSTRRWLRKMAVEDAKQLPFSTQVVT